MSVTKGGGNKHKKQVQCTLLAIYSAGNKTDPLLSKTGRSSTKSSAEESEGKVKKGEKKQGKGDGKKAKKDKKKPRKESKEAPRVEEFMDIDKDDVISITASDMADTTNAPYAQLCTVWIPMA